MLNRLLLTVAAFSALAGMAAAQPTSPPGADGTGVGPVTLAELQSQAREHFGRLDLNHDGRITRDEAAQAREQARAARSGLGPDGVMTREQYRARADERFARLDANSDGRLTADEMHGRRSRPTSASPDAATPPQSRRRSGPGSALGGTGRFGVLGGRSLEALMGLDGEVTLDEINAAIAERFARMDTNHDGVLTPEDRPVRGGRRGFRSSEAPETPPAVAAAPG